jgi:hypothetical protein
MVAEDTPNETHNELPSAPRERRWSFRGRRTRLALLGVALGVAFFTLVGPISFGRKSATTPVLPNTQKQFSLDLKIIGKVKHDVVYAVEQRAFPAYRIFAFDPATGRDTTVFPVPKNAIVFGISLSPDRSTLAVSYSSDFHVYGSGLSLLDLESKKFTEITPATPGLFDVNLEWSSDSKSVYSTRVDQRTPIEQLDIWRTSVVDGTSSMVIRNGVNPRFHRGTLYFLDVDSSRARRSIRALDGPTISVGTGALDLDHLLKGSDDETLRVGVLESTSASITVGTPASAHGNHDVASTFWNVAVSGASNAAPVGLNSTIVYDAASRGASIVYATQEGLSIAMGSTQTDLIASRAIRLVAA